MKYTTEVEIARPIDQVVALFDNPENLKKWMPGLQSFEHLSGVAGQPGAKSLLKFKMGSREIEMVETITTRNLPHEFSGTYHAKGVFNRVKNEFFPMDEHRTRYVQETEFTFTGFMKLIGFLMPASFKKQTAQFMNDFKHFAEKA